MSADEKAEGAGATPAMSRAERLQGYKELKEGLAEMRAMASEDDVEMQALIADALTELRRFAESLNAEETIEVTPGLVKLMLPRTSSQHESTQETTTKEPSEADTMTVILYPPPTQPQLAAPYEVFYDERSWYPCVITHVVPPSDPIERVQYRAWILGYNVEELVYSESLRPWRASSSLSEQLRSGVACHVIHPRTGCFVGAVVERLTLEGTVVVRLTPQTQAERLNDTPSTAEDKAKDDAKPCDVLELPLSHVQLGTVYARLFKKPKLTEEQKAARRAENAQRKRARQEMTRQLKADQIAQDSSDWQSLISDLGGVAPPRRRR